MASVGVEPGRLKVFISYSRKDEDFAQDLLAGLQAAGFEPYLDKHDIAAGEDWEARLGRLIETADTVVFVISPDAVASERCAWEVERSVNLKKRLLPIVSRRVEEAQVPPRLKQLNYIYFDRPHSFGASTLALSTALRTDINWIREHTRIGEDALRWDARGRVDALLLRAEELAAAKKWLKAQPKYAPEPTLLHHEFIKAGEDSEAARASADQQRLDQMRAALEREKAALRKGQRALSAAVGLFACVIAGTIGWYNQSYLKEQYHWRVKMGPSVLTAEQERGLHLKQDFKECAIGCPTMIVIPAGKFMMGSNIDDKGSYHEESPQHVVTIDRPFAVAKFAVTFAEWDSCTDAGACPRAPDDGWGREDRPVIEVSWAEAKSYVAWISRVTGKNYRLLSEAEFEYAARAGTVTGYPWGNEIGEGNANCKACGSHWDGKGPAPVGSFKPNAFGLYDMHGNVYTWCEDVWHDSFIMAPSDGSSWEHNGDARRRVVRGGSWYDPPDLLRSAARGGNDVNFRVGIVGFRIARALSTIAP